MKKWTREWVGSKQAEAEQSGVRPLERRVSRLEMEGSFRVTAERKKRTRTGRQCEHAMGNRRAREG